MVDKNTLKPFVSLTSLATATAQLETGAMMQTGAAVASMMYANFSLEMRNLSVIGLITVPTVRQLNPSSIKIRIPRKDVANAAALLLFRCFSTHLP